MASKTTTTRAITPCQRLSQNASAQPARARSRLSIRAAFGLRRPAGKGRSGRLMRSTSMSIKSLKALPAPLINAAERAASSMAGQAGAWSAVKAPMPTERAVIRPLSGRGRVKKALSCDKGFRLCASKSSYKAKQTGHRQEAFGDQRARTNLLLTGTNAQSRFPNVLFLNE